MRNFTWCRQELAKDCQLVGNHVHICIATPGGRTIAPSCGFKTLNLFFHDLDPEAIRRTNAFADDPDKGQQMIDNCFTIDQAKEIASFVNVTNEDIQVNCEAGISRSPGVVLALRRKYGGDTEEVYKKAHPNVHVASTLGRELGVGPFQAPKNEGIVNPFSD